MSTPPFIGPDFKLVQVSELRRIRRRAALLGAVSGAVASWLIAALALLVRAL